jgi:hypothetical protein
MVQGLTFTSVHDCRTQAFHAQAAAISQWHILSVPWLQNYKRKILQWEVEMPLNQLIDSLVWKENIYQTANCFPWEFTIASPCTQKEHFFLCIFP